MTSKEAKSCIKTIEMLRRLAYNIHGVMDVIDADNCEKIIKALEQEPCEVSEYDKDHIWYKGGQYISLRRFLEVKAEAEQEQSGDLISREAVIDAIDKWVKNMGVIALPKREGTPLLERIHKLPSVNPQEPKTGRWIEHFDESGKWYECDQCYTDWGGTVNYCPNCGAKMQEVEE